MPPQCVCIICKAKASTAFVHVFLEGVYNSCTSVFLKGFYNNCAIVFEECLQHLYMCSWKVFTAVVQVLFLFFVRLLEHLYKCFVQGSYTSCTIVLNGTSVCWKVVTAFVQVFVERLLQKLYECLWKVFTASVQVFLKDVYNIRTGAFCKAVTTSVQGLSARLLQQFYKCFGKGFYQSFKCDVGT